MNEKEFFKKKQKEWNVCSWGVFEPIYARNFHEVLRESDKFVKFRLFDNFCYPPMIKNGGRHILSSRRILARGKNITAKFFQEIDRRGSWIMACSYQSFDFNLLGYYDMENYIVFCSYPNMSTLKASYANNPTDTIIKIKKCYNLNETRLNHILKVIS